MENEDYYDKQIMLKTVKSILSIPNTERTDQNIEYLTEFSQDFQFF